MENTNAQDEKRQRELNLGVVTCYLVASAARLCGIFWRRQAVASEKAEVSGSSVILDETERQLREYFAGERQGFDIPINLAELEGTEFQRQVWSQLQTIPYGETCSYKELATSLGKPKAWRAIGTANGRNPLSIVIPCHRVIAADGSLGGYAGTLSVKRILLELEQAE